MNKFPNWNRKIPEPVASVSPKIHTGDEFKMIKQKSDESLSLLCPAQSYPTPIFRYGFSLSAYIGLVFISKL